MNDLDAITENSEPDDGSDSPASEPGQQYLSFALGEETYAVNILNVQEIRTWEMPARLPRAPDYLKGVINLRGTIMPIIDLRLKFRLCEATYHETTVVIVLRTERDDKTRIMGVVVDAMTDVVQIPAKDIKPAPEFGGKIDAEFIEGLAMIEQDIVSILNTDTLLDISNISHAYQ